MEYLFVLAGAFALLFAAILIFSRGRNSQQQHWIFAVLSLLVAISSYYVFLMYKKNGEYYEPWFSEINYAIPLLYGVLLWFYTRALINKKLRMGWLDLLHFFPFVFFLGFLFYPLLTNTESLAPERYGFPIIKLIVNPIYIFLMLFTLSKHRKKLLDQFSYIDHMHHYWLNWIAYGALALWIVACLGNLYNVMHNSDSTLLGDYFLVSFLAAYLFMLAYVGFNRTQVFQSGKKIYIKGNESVDISSDNLDLDQKKEAEDLYQKLLSTMKAEKPYLDPKLSLYSLAKITGIPSTKLSQLINAEAGHNFYEFINSYRVEEVKNRLEDPNYSNYSILGIAEESGFNSKASFNRIFKKQVGLTPSEYLNSIANGLRTEN